jgi:hypothetical protein
LRTRIDSDPAEEDAVPKLLQIDFPVQDAPWGDAMADAYGELADLIGKTPGLRWKIWTESRDEGLQGGVYLFDDDASARRYLEEHTARLEGFGITGIRAKLFDVNDRLTAANRGPVG